jgi:hypothetical protein
LRSGVCNAVRGQVIKTQHEFGRDACDMIAG